MTGDQEHIETITAKQVENGMWIAAFDGVILGDCKPCETSEECMTWARKFFGPNFNYQD